jgi:hypothetical protein
MKSFGRLGCRTGAPQTERSKLGPAPLAAREPSIRTVDLDTSDDEDESLGDAQFVRQCWHYLAVMARVFVTGMSGAGESTVLADLRKRGCMTLDTDYDGWVDADGRWDEQRVVELLASSPDLVVSGTVENQARFYDRFDHVVLLDAPLAVLLDRAASHTNNPYGQSVADRTQIIRYYETVGPLLRRGATVEVDARLPLGEVANQIEALLTRPT